MRGPISKLTLAAALLIAVSACSSDDGVTSSTSAGELATTAGDAATTQAEAATTAAATTEAPATTAEPTTTTEAPDVLRILVTNDDGVGASGIDTLVSALTQLDDVEVTVIAPAENQSGVGASTTDGPLTVADATTASGYPAKSVAGFPADTVIYALDQGGLAERPELIVSGINEGQNVGPAVAISGTIGAAQAGAKRGIPGFASSAQNFVEVEGEPAVVPDYRATADVVIAWIEQNRDNLNSGSMPPIVYNLNGPTCTSGSARSVVTVPVALSTEGRDFYEPADCVLEPAGPPTDDMDALVKGYFSYTELDPETLAPVA